MDIPKVAPSTARDDVERLLKSLPKKVEAQPKPKGQKKHNRSTNYERKNMPRRAPKSKTAWMMKNIGDTVHAILPTDIEPATTEVSSQLDFETLCSYNWQMNGKGIYVPGGPPKWVSPTLPTTLPPDSGLQFIDQNASRVPKYPFEPAFRALAVMNPEVRFDEIDIIANRNSLRKLLDFVAGKRQDPFRMDLHMVKDTLFISRKEKNAKSMIHGFANSGFGHNMETAFTVPLDGLDRSSSHHRVIRYHLGDLNCVVRFEVDSYYEDADLQNDVGQNTEVLDNVISSMEKLVINKLPKVPTVQGATPVMHKGELICSSKLAEIKARKNERLNDAMPQLWFGRTPYLLTGKHVKGIVHSVSCTHAKLQFPDWEKNNQDNLRKLASVLAELKRIVRGMEERAAVLVCEPKGAPITIFKAAKDTSVLPEDILLQFWSL